MTDKVVITGLGAITPVGHSVAETWSNLVEGQSGIGTMCSRFNPPRHSNSRQ